MSSRDLNDLTPELFVLALEFLGTCKRAKLDIVIICTYRSNHDQLLCYESGASNCKPGMSQHNCVNSMGRPASRAFDVGVIRNGKYIGDGDDPDYQKAGEIGESLGLEWAGRWVKFKETAHFQLPVEKSKLANANNI